MKRRTMLMFGLPAAAVALMVYGIAKREWALSALQHVATEQAALPVEIITPRPGPTTRPLILPGTVRAWYEAPIFGQVAGYVHSWNEDYGATVRRDSCWRRSIRRVWMRSTRLRRELSAWQKRTIGWR